jgi:hypothetical protein
MINELDILFEKTNYTKKDHKIFITNFTKIMKEIRNMSLVKEKYCMY